MAIPPPSPGWNRLLMKSAFGAGRDFEVTDLDGNHAYRVDGKIGTRPKADVLDAAGDVVYHVRGTLIGIPKRITISDAGGSEVAHLKAKAFSFVKDKMTLDVVDGPQWQLEGSLIEKDYEVSADGRPVVHITQKWVTVRDQYVVDVAEGVDAGLALAVVWAVDRWVERD
jgi:uncharacterized protein YxjI